MQVDHKKMRALWRAAVLLLAICALFASCSKTRKIKYENGTYNDTKSDVSYVRVDANYMPVATGEKYAEIKLKHETIELFRVTGLEPTKWLTSKDGTLYKNAEIKTPTLEELKINKVEFCVETSIIVQRFSVSDAQAIEGLIRACAETEKISITNRAEKNLFKLMMVSEAYPELFYTVSYVEYAEDVHVYKEIENENDVEGITSYDGVSYEVYSEVDGEGVERWYADCNFGKCFIYSAHERKYVPVFDLFEGLIEE